MNCEIKLAYSRGYNAGRGKRWPDHLPIFPPQEHVAELMRAAKELRDEVDCQIATMDEDDEYALALAPKIDELDDAFTAINEWMATAEAKE